MDVVTLLEADFPLPSTASKTHTPPDPSPTKSVSGSKRDQKSDSDDAASREDPDPSTDQSHISEKPTGHFPLRPESSHRHSSIDARHSASSVQKATPAASASVDSMESTSASGVPYCSRCGLLRTRSALHPNHYTCHTPLVIGDPDHELTSHLGPELLGQRSRLVVEDGRSFD
jgi:hypothetical protein